MKSLSLLLFALVVRVTALYADENAASISQVFVKESGSYNVYVLQLKEDGTYDYSRYTNRRVYHDFGDYRTRKGKIEFISKNRKHGFNSVGGKVYFMNKKGIFKTRVDAITGKKAVLSISQDPIYMRSWDYNPITGKTIAEMEAEKAAKAQARITPAQRNKQLAAFTKKFYFSEAATYASDYKTILEQRGYCGPECFRVSWNYDTTKSALVDDFSTVIYESTRSTNTNYILVIPGIEIPVTQTPTFYSYEATIVAPVEAPAKISRFRTYVGDSSMLASNVSGIYGLVSEFSAFENATRASVMAARTAKSMGDNELASEFLEQANANYYAAYEFKLFIAWYLHFAKVSRPQVYREVMDNQNLRVAYTLIDQEFALTIEDLRQASNEMGKSDLFASTESSRAAYPKQLLAKEKKYIDPFAVKGVNKANFLEHIR